MIIGISRQQSGFTGGFEYLTAKIAKELERSGHEIKWLQPGSSVPIGLSGLTIPEDIRTKAEDFFGYIEQVAAFAEIQADVDVVLSTQPPSQAVTGPPQVALFYHHFRAHYDLADLWVEAGLTDEDTHELCTRSVRRIDEKVVYSNVDLFVAGSDTIARRLERYNPGSSVVVERAPLHREAPSVKTTRRDHVLCVSRHEFPKRTELFVAAMKLVPDQVGEMVGSGGRLGWVMDQDEEWSSSPSQLLELEPRSIWLRAHEWKPPPVPHASSNVRFRGRISDIELERLYAGAICLVAPAYDEDYGLTALEAMAHGKPVVVCDDGGGLVETVETFDAGLVVPPDHKQIAAAIRLLSEDPELSYELGQRGREASASLDWDEYGAAITNLLEAQL